jgi:hypothetical protein
MTSDQNKPWTRMRRIYDPNDPVVQKWLEIMEEHRKRFDEDPDAYYAYLCELKSALDADEDGTV